MAHPTVLTFGARPERLLDTEGRIDCFLEPPGADQLDLLVEALQSGIDAGGALVAIVPDWFDPDGVMRLQMALSLVDSARVALHPTALPPLAATALASLASAAGRSAGGAGLLASLLADFETELLVVSWLGSVSGLSTPAPTLRQHMASLTPGTAFAVSSYPEPAVHRLHGRPDDVPLPPPLRAVRLAVCDHGGDPSWVRDTIAPALGVQEIRDVEPTPAGARWWGTAKLVEAVAYPLDAAAITAELLSARDTWPCRWCGEIVARTPCPMCGHRGAPNRVRG